VEAVRRRAGHPRHLPRRQPPEAAAGRRPDHRQGGQEPDRARQPLGLAGERRSTIWDRRTAAVKYRRRRHRVAQTGSDQPCQEATIGHLVHHFRAIERPPTTWISGSAARRSCSTRTSRPRKPRPRVGDVLDQAQLPSYLYYLDHRDAMDAGAEISWPEVRSLYVAAARQSAKNVKAFATEMQGEPRSDEDKVFCAGHLHQRSAAADRFVHLGPATHRWAKGEKSHPSAILGGRRLGPRARRPACDRGAHQAPRAEQAGGGSDRVPARIPAGAHRLREQQCLRALPADVRYCRHARRRRAAADRLARRASSARFASRAWSRSSPTPWRRASCSTPALTQLLGELDSWPERQATHDYDGLCALYILWDIALHVRAPADRRLPVRPPPRFARRSPRRGRLRRPKNSRRMMC
jgi:hypothetical protein